MLAVCAAYGYEMEQLDADTAFLNSNLDERVYMEVPLGASTATGMVCKLEKAIYGLKQSASAWNKTIRRVFLNNGFKSCGRINAYMSSITGTNLCTYAYTSTT